MKVLALDPATTTGWAFYDEISVSDAGYVTFVPTEQEGDRLLQAHRWLKSLIYEMKPDLILGEGYFSSGRFANGSNVNHELRGVFKMTSFEAGLSYTIVGPSEWKKALCGRTTPTKAEKKLHGKEKAKKMMTVDALTALGLIVPVKIRNVKTGNMINFKFDTTDALGILTAHLQAASIAVTFSADLFSQE